MEEAAVEVLRGGTSVTEQKFQDRHRRCVRSRVTKI